MKIQAPRSVKPETVDPEKVLREVLRHYYEFRELVVSGGSHILEHSYLVDNGEETVRKETISFSFWDLHRGISELPRRKREALYYNVILDQKQKDVAKRMGITSVSVGSYVNLALRQLIKYHFTTTEEHID